MKSVLQWISEWLQRREFSDDDILNAEIDNSVHEYTKTVTAAQAARGRRSETMSVLRRSLESARNRTDAWADVDDFVAQHTKRKGNSRHA